MISAASSVPAMPGCTSPQLDTRNTLASALSPLGRSWVEPEPEYVFSTVLPSTGIPPGQRSRPSVTWQDMVNEDIANGRMDSEEALSM